MELTTTYTIEITEITKDAGTINAILADDAKNIAAMQEANLRRDVFSEVDDLHVRDVKRFLREDDE